MVVMGPPSVTQSVVGREHGGAGPARTMWAGLYGPYKAHPLPRSVGAMEADAYQLFFARSAGMRWLTDAALVGAPGLWGMNDAGLASADTDPAQPAGWFQVVLTDPEIAHPLLPVQPLLGCAADVMARLGALALTSVQVLLPAAPRRTTAELPSGMRAVDGLADTAGWFANCDPGSRARVSVSLTCRGTCDLVALTTSLLRPPRAPWQSTVRWERAAQEAVEPPTVPPHIAHELGADEQIQSLRLDGDLVEWSIDAVAWVAAYLAHVAHDAGLTSPLLLTISQPLVE